MKFKNKLLLKNIFLIQRPELSLNKPGNNSIEPNNIQIILIEIRQCLDRQSGVSFLASKKTIKGI